MAIWNAGELVQGALLEICVGDPRKEISLRWTGERDQWEMIQAETDRTFMIGSQMPGNGVGKASALTAEGETEEGEEGKQSVGWLGDCSGIQGGTGVVVGPGVDRSLGGIWIESGKDPAVDGA